jgi:membrane protease YdiL (CAAX protease family)
MWLLAVRRLRAGEPLVPFELRRPVPWGGIEVLLIVLGYLVASGLTALYFVIPIGEGAAVSVVSSLSLAITGLASLLVIGCGALLLRRVAGATWRDLGLSRRHLLPDVRLGLAAGLAITAPVYAIQSIFTTLFKFKSEHPLIEMVERGQSFTIFAVAVYLAVGVAPLAEEFLFRVLLQGWLEAWLTRRAAERQLNAAMLENVAAKVDNAESPTAVSVDSDNPYAAPLAMPVSSQTSASPPLSGMSIDAQLDLVAGQLVPGWAPLVTSAVIFALLHATQGPDPVALLPLALVLGYLYRQTHRLVPSLVAHAFLNATSMLLLWLQLA